MKKLLSLLLITCILTNTATAQSKNTGAADRQYWLNHMDQLARPILTNLAKNELRKNMPVELSNKTDNPANRKRAAYLEAFARLISGIGPWLNLEGGNAKEVALRKEYRQLVLKGMSNAVNPAAKDYMEWHTGGQPLVDASFLALGMLRCPWIWDNMDTTTRRQLIDAFLLTRKVRPAYSNWLLFSAIIEAFFARYNYPWDEMRVDLALKQMEKWYVGDGIYSDGDKFHYDYYNSYVIHPYLTQILETLTERGNFYKSMREKVTARGARYALIQERLINADGSFPATGRSLVYRGGAFHHLADIAWRNKLPDPLKPAQVRAALTAVIKKTTESPTTFTKEGWLTIGLYGAQPGIADSYNNTGSLYLCADILLPLGLPETAAFWSAPNEMWTAQKVWSGMEVTNDHAVD